MSTHEKRFKTVVAKVLNSYKAHSKTSRIGAGIRPDKGKVMEIIDKLQWVLFPGYFGRVSLKEEFTEYYVGEVLENIHCLLMNQMIRSFSYVDNSLSGEEIQNSSQEIAISFLEQIPKIRSLLETDVQSAYDGDPAAMNLDEIIFSYPGLYAIMVNRIAHELYLLNVPLIPRIMTEHAHSLTGIDIHPGAVIGEYFFMDHGTGIVIGETTVIGNNVKIYQGVTLGALSTRGGQTLRGVKRHPTLEDGVTVYSGASILGGDTIIGAGVTIGSNAFVTKTVPAKTRVSVRNPELQFKDSVVPKEFSQDEFWYWTI